MESLVAREARPENPESTAMVLKIVPGSVWTLKTGKAGISRGQLARISRAGKGRVHT